MAGAYCCSRSAAQPIQRRGARSGASTLRESEQTIAAAAAAARQGSAAMEWHSSSPLRILVKRATSRADLISGACRGVEAAGAADQSSAAWSSCRHSRAEQRSVELHLQ
jgi:hypothetical protein